MKLNDSITTYDIAEALQGENGNLQPFLVRKVAQPVHSEGRSKRSVAA